MEETLFGQTANRIKRHVRGYADYTLTTRLHTQRTRSLLKMARRSEQFGQNGWIGCCQACTVYRVSCDHLHVALLQFNG